MRTPRFEAEASDDRDCEKRTNAVPDDNMIRPETKRKSAVPEAKTASTAEKKDASDADDVLASGRFFRDSAGALHFIDSKTGRACPANSPAFKAHVAKVTGVNRKDKDFAATLAEVEDRGREEAKPGRTEYCSAFDREGRRFLVNMGAGRIVEVNTKGEISPVDNGEGGVVFRDEEGFAPVNWQEWLTYAMDRRGRARALADVRAHVFDFPPLAQLTRNEAAAVVLAYWIGFFFDREFARAKPLLLFVGPIGSGKTMCSRKLGCTLYGPAFEVSVSASPDRGVKDLAAAVAHATLTVRDDLNAAPPGLIELLLCVATGARFDLSAFHETLARQSFVMRGSVIFTASKPRWAKREDLLSRLLIVRVDRDNRPRATEESEEDRLARANTARSAAWYLALEALGSVLASSDRPATLTRFRTWEQAARAALKPYGLHDAFVSALAKMKDERTELALGSDPFLGLLLALARQRPGHAWTAAGINSALGEVAGNDSPNAARPRDPQELGKLLEHIEREGGAVVRVERVGMAHRKVAKWALYPADEGAEGVEGVEAPTKASSSRALSSLSRKRSNPASTPSVPSTPSKASSRTTGRKAGRR
jgi:hypothetical protein